jgi:hypothetical protein
MHPAKGSSTSDLMPPPRTNVIPSRRSAAASSNAVLPTPASLAKHEHATVSSADTRDQAGEESDLAISSQQR